jgi:dTDP-4-dehydrorhamnose 3,5-epimerase
MGQVIYSKINVIHQDKGDIFKLLSKDSINFDKFGEAYYSNINFDEIKGWKKHLKMQCILLPVSGDVDVVTFNEESNRFEKFNLNITNPYRLVIPPNIVFAFRGNEVNNCLLNIGNILHDPEESLIFNLDEFKYNW